MCSENNVLEILLLFAADGDEFELQQTLAMYIFPIRFIVFSFLPIDSDAWLDTRVRINGTYRNIYRGKYFIVMGKLFL